ncbi:LIC11755 family lipoprotein [Leptospira ilyithenensis]|uniref:Lamin tail domain-containing protein n=1 Tax=Leptospira ilyithenensis TaxID=2484901 RepID=A0A4R9LK65_9LEPT|nr:hypothetical protein [Leptospira ilyithenensis]TGN07912.1 hypothetical protein EHS11_13280 [Leptospira ilyithenensis]
MRLQNLVLGFLFVWFFLSCMRKGNSDSIFPFPIGSSLNSPVFQFSYGEEIFDQEFSEERFLDSGEDGFCLLSLPKVLFDRETGAKFKICLPSDPDTKPYWENSFSLLDEIIPSEHPREGWGKGWHARHLKLSEWEKEHRNQIPLESYAKNSLSDGTIAYSRFDVPNAEFYRWSEKECEILFPSRILATTVSQIRFISLEFACSDPISLKDKIVEQNQKWLQVCRPDLPVVSESFRHSDSIYKRYLEWENPSEEVTCPEYESFGFEETDSLPDKKIFAKDLEFLKSFHKLILPKSVFLFRDSDTMSGLKLDSGMAEKIGKVGFWNLNGNLSIEPKYIFSQGGEYFANSRRKASCRNTLNYYITKDSFCGNPGLPNEIAGALLESKFREKSCVVENIRLSEYFSGTGQSTFNLGAYLEWVNDGEVCDLSSLELTYEGDVFPLQSKSKPVSRGEVFLISRSVWEGWSFSSLTKPFSTKQIKYQIPELKITERESGKSKIIFRSEDHYALTHKGGFAERSILVSADGSSVPHPNLNSHPYFVSKGLQISPGDVFVFDRHSYLPLEISEVLFKGTKDGIGSYSERFLEWKSPLDAEGFVYFSIETDRKRNFVFWKEKDNFFPFVHSGSFACISLVGIDLPEGILGDWTTTITTSDSLFGSVRSGNPKFQFSYNPLIYQDFGIDQNIRVSIHPETHPFLNSFSKKTNVSCSDFTYFSPGEFNQKGIQIAGLEKPVSESEKILKTDVYFLLPENLREGTSRLFSGNHSVSFPLIFETSFSETKLANAEFQNLDAFLSDEIIFSEFSFSFENFHQTMIHRQGSVVIEGVFPNPAQSGNEWVYICNRSNHSEDLSRFLIEDENSSDGIVSYHTRFPNKIPNFLSNSHLDFGSGVLDPGDCGWIVDPDGENWYFPPIIRNTDKLLTVVSTSTIGNGIAAQEKLDLYKMENGDRIHISSYGKKTTLSPFSVKTETDQYSLLIPGKIGNGSKDFQIFQAQN